MMLKKQDKLTMSLKGFFTFFIIIIEILVLRDHYAYINWLHVAVVIFPIKGAIKNDLHYISCRKHLIV